VTKEERKARFEAWMNKFGRACNKITLCFVYIWTMIVLAYAIFGSLQQKMTSNVTITYKVPTYTITFDPQGGGYLPAQSKLN
jgi:hypothetical protein